MLDLPDSIKLECPKHGPGTEFVRVEFALWYRCKSGMDAPLGEADPAWCGYVVLDESITPDGASAVLWDGLVS